MNRALLPTLLSLLLHSTAFQIGTAAAADAFGAPLGRLELSFEPDGSETERAIQTFRPFRFYLVAEVDFADIESPELNALSGIGSWEAGVRVAPEILILERVARSACCGPDCLDKRGSFDNWIVELCNAGANGGQRVVLVEYLAMLNSLDVTDLRIGIVPPSPSHLEQAGSPRPGWLELSPTGECGVQSCWRAFGEWSGNALWINPVSVGTERESFSGLKSRF